MLARHISFTQRCFDAVRTVRKEYIEAVLHRLLKPSSYKSSKANRQGLHLLLHYIAIGSNHGVHAAYAVLSVSKSLVAGSNGSGQEPSIACMQAGTSLF